MAAPDPLQHVKPGDQLYDVVTADVMNALKDAARRTRKGMLPPPSGGRASNTITPSLTILVRNDTGGDLSAGYIVAISDKIGDPVNEPIPFGRRPVVAGDMPASATDLIAILTEPIPEDEFGRAVVMGIAVCEVEINDVGHGYAVPIAADETKLESAASGPVRIEWKESSGAIRRCVVLLGNFQTGGSFEAQEVDGTPSTTTRIDFPNTSLTDNGDGTVTLKSASATAIGLVNLTDGQSMGLGRKKFNAGVVVESSGGASTWPLLGPSLYSAAVGGTIGIYILETISGNVASLELFRDSAPLYDVQLMVRANATGLPVAPGVQPRFLVSDTTGAQKGGGTANVSGMLFYGGLYDSGSITLTSASVSDFTEAAQDAVGAMCTDGTLVYVDGTPLLTRGALTGDVTAAQGSNATTIANDAVTTAKILDGNVTAAKLAETYAQTSNNLSDLADAPTARTNLGLGALAILNAAADVDPLTDSTGGTANTTLVAISGSGDDANINDNFADIAAKIAELISSLQTAGIMAT